MSQSGYSAQTVAVGSVQDSLLQKPVGTGVQAITPTIPPAIAQTAADTGVGPQYTKTSNTVLVLTLPSAPGFTTASKMGVFWEDGGGNDHFLLDCTITSISAGVVTITAPGTIPTGMSDFTTVTAGTTEVTFSVATLATTDTPGNPDLTDYSLPAANIRQLVLMCNQTGAFELFTVDGLVLSWNYSSAGDFYSWIAGGAGPWSGTVITLRFYNSAMKAQTMSVGALMA